MLLHLSIHNYALISNLEIDLGSGFSVMTGETGAGKSIILGALALLMGGRADSKAITEGEQKCVIEGEFSLKGYGLESFFAREGLDYSEITSIRRELTITGKSRSFINDTPVTLNQLKPLAQRLIDIHSQHQNLLLSDERFCLEIVDSLANNPQEREDYSAKYVAYKEAERKLIQLRREASESKKNADFTLYQYEQLEGAHLQSGELQELEQQQSKLANAEEIRLAYSSVIEALNTEEGAGALMLIKEAIRSLRSIEEFIPADENLIERLQSVNYELQDMADTAERELEDTECNPMQLIEIEDRISELNTLLRKFAKNTVEELILMRDELNEQLGKNDSYDFEIAQQEKLTQQALTSLEKSAKALTKSRKAVGDGLKKSLEERLSRLGVLHASISLQISELAEYEEAGKDKATILFAANKNQTLRDVSEIASGGEMARLMLSIKALIADTQGLPTIIFDEVDTGVSGEVADEMGSIMNEMARERQIIAITHLPQIASKGERHYKVYKEDTETRTETHIRELNKEERIDEIALLLSGASVTQEAKSNAKKLLGY